MGAYCISPKHLIYMGHRVFLWASSCVLLIFLVGIFLRWHFFICAVQMARTKCPTSRSQTLCIIIFCSKNWYTDYLNWYKIGNRPYKSTVRICYRDYLAMENNSISTIDYFDVLETKLFKIFWRPLSFLQSLFF